MSLETTAKPAAATGPAGPPVVPLTPLPSGWTSVQAAFVREARAHPSKLAMADGTKARLTYGETFLRAAVLARVLGRVVGPARYVGLLIPPTVPAAVANLAVVLLGKIPVNLNYTVSQAIVDSSIAQCGITHVITSQKVLDRFGIVPSATLLKLEDVPAMVRPDDKLWGAVVAKGVPLPLLGMFLPGLRGDRLDDTATVIFTSGSTGEPKGVVLTQRNVLSNVHQITSHLRLLPDEMVLGILPFFHSFGFTVTIWTVLCTGKSVVYHVNPLDARVIGDLCETHGVTMIATTPTFMRTYLKKCEPRQFAKLSHLLLGAEKTKAELSHDVRAQLGIDALEGYGCTELSPVVSVNVPHDLETADGRTLHGYRLGTVGRPVPGTEIKTVDPETEADLPHGSTGLIHVRGPQVMSGYLDKPEATAKVLRDGWYNTGDLGYVDDDGFLRITDRLSRFSKIGGEMVPHLGVEAAIARAAGRPESCLAVTALPDPKRGERLFVIHTDELEVSPAEIHRRLVESDLPRLWIPAADDFIRVEAIPVLGQGKTDLKGLKDVAATKRAH